MPLGFLPLPLNIGYTIASLNTFGNMPVLKLMLQILAIGLAKTFVPFFKISVEIPCTLMALEFFKFLTILVTPPAVT